jgi:hypothetical protein
MPSRDGSSGNSPVMRLDDASSHGFCILLDFDWFSSITSTKAFLLTVGLW